MPLRPCRHCRLAAELGIEIGDVEKHLQELRQIAAGVALVGEVSDRTRARVMATGELMATELGARYLRTQGLDVAWADARTMLRAEDRRSASAKASVLSATCNFAPDTALEERLSTLAPIVITQGFIASDDDGNTVLLGRGGIPTSSAYLAAKLRAQRLEIWTDVPGMFSANPRSTPTARLLRALHYDEAQEIATSGAKVLHPRCILPARQYRIPLHIYATQAPELEGTVLSAEGADGGAQVKAVCTKKGITLISMDSPAWLQGGLSGRCLPGVQGARHVGRPGFDLGNQCHRIALDPAGNTLDNSLLSELINRLLSNVLAPSRKSAVTGVNSEGQTRSTDMPLPGRHQPESPPECGAFHGNQGNATLLRRQPSPHRRRTHAQHRAFEQRAGGA